TAYRRILTPWSQPAEALFSNQETKRPNRSPLLVNADDKVAFGILSAGDAQSLRRVHLSQDEHIAFPADKLFNQHRLVLLVDDHIASAYRRLVWIHMKQPTLFVPRLHTVTDHVDRVRRTYPAEIGRARRVAD